MIRRHGLLRHAFLLLLVSLGLGLAGCEGDDGAPGADGAAGASGADGADGINCWDLNANGVEDLADEDINGDGVVDVLDCNAFAGGAYDNDQLHVGWFTEKPYEGTESCLDCHGRIADEFVTTAHFEWEGVAENLVPPFDTEIHGKNDIINNFCIAVPSNEGRCTQCHAGYGYSSQAFDFGDPDNVDCLVCHDQTTTYAKAPTTAGQPVPAVDLQLVAQSVAMNGGTPTIDNCIDCHAKAGGGDNVKHGDLSMSLVNTTREYDVHMGTDGADFECVACHQVQRDADGNMLSHGIGGMPYHSVDEGEMRQCDDCHGDALNIHAGSTVEVVLNVAAHQRLACQACHIPAFARNTSTKVEWYWEDAGQVVDPIPVDDTVTPPRATYDIKKGSFVWANNVRPTLRWFNGKYDKALINANDTFVTPPAVLADPQGDYSDPDAMIYPFKKMVGNQPYDTDDNQLLVPHLFGMAGGPNPFWVAYDWDLALQDADLITNQGYSGNFGFVDTEMYLSVNHEIAPAEEAFGYNGDCGDCHIGPGIDWQLLGWTEDPVNGGTRL